MARNHVSKLQALLESVKVLGRKQQKSKLANLIWKGIHWKIRWDLTDSAPWTENRKHSKSPWRRGWLCLGCGTVQSAENLGGGMPPRFPRLYSEPLKIKLERAVCCLTQCLDFLSITYVFWHRFIFSSTAINEIKVGFFALFLLKIIKDFILTFGAGFQVFLVWWLHIFIVNNNIEFESWLIPKDLT